MVLTANANRIFRVSEQSAAENHGEETAKRLEDVSFPAQFPCVVKKEKAIEEIIFSN